MVIAAVLSWVAFVTMALGSGEAFTVPVLRFIDSGGMQAEWALRIDTLTAVMLVVVNTVSCLVHIYSIGYMHHDPHRPRFFAYLSLFTFAMLMLVTSDNLVQMFFGWEGVGLASYLLIGFWYKKPSANAAAIKAFVVNRVGDFGFAARPVRRLRAVRLGRFRHHLRQRRHLPAGRRPWRGSGRRRSGGTWRDRAQFPRLSARQGVRAHRRLPAAVHGRDGQVGAGAAAHLAAGRHGRPDAGFGADPRRHHGHRRRLHAGAPVADLRTVAHALIVVTCIGALTAFFAATVGLVQNDIKRVIAYSTCSQLGYMFVALGMGFYSAAIFHLFTHAFFKALLFLGSGSVIHAVSDEQDMRKMGGLRKLIPKTYWMMIIGTLALTGVGIPLTIIGTAGFFSKDAIIEGVRRPQPMPSSAPSGCWSSRPSSPASISWRLIFMTFHGRPRASHEVMHHVHESPPVMLVPLFILAVGALFAGVAFQEFFIGEGYEHFWKGRCSRCPTTTSCTISTTCRCG